MCSMMAAGEVDWHGGLTSVRQDECGQKVSHNHVTSQKTGSKTHRYVTSQRGGQKNTITWHHRKLGQNPQTCDITERRVKNPQSHEITEKGVKNSRTLCLKHMTSQRGVQKPTITWHSSKGGQKPTNTWHHRGGVKNPQSCDIMERGSKSDRHATLCYQASNGTTMVWTASKKYGVVLRFPQTMVHSVPM